MELISDEKNLIGKTIEAAGEVDFGDAFALRFTDGTCAVLNVRYYGDTRELYLDDTVSDYVLKHVEELGKPKKRED